MSASPRPVRQTAARSRSPSEILNTVHSANHDNSHLYPIGNYLNPRNLELNRVRREVSENESIPLIDNNMNPALVTESEMNIENSNSTNNAVVPVDASTENSTLEIQPNSTKSREDDIDGVRSPNSPRPNGPLYYPNDGIVTFPETEAGTFIGDSAESLPDLNVYQHKKTLAQGMMDLALFSANANQLRYVLDNRTHPYYYSGIVLISFSLVCQILIGCGLIWNSRYNVKDEKQICIANKINNFTVIGIFLVTVVNVFICAFGVANGDNTAQQIP